MTIWPEYLVRKFYFLSECLYVFVWFLQWKIPVSILIVLMNKLVNTFVMPTLFLCHVFKAHSWLSLCYDVALTWPLVFCIRQLCVHEISKLVAVVTTTCVLVLLEKHIFIYILLFVALACFDTYWASLFTFWNTLFGSGSLTWVQYPKCAYGPYCKLNPF